MLLIMQIFAICRTKSNVLLINSGYNSIRVLYFGVFQNGLQFYSRL